MFDENIACMYPRVMSETWENFYKGLNGATTLKTLKNVGEKF